MDHVQRSRRAYGGSAARHLEMIGRTLSDAVETPDDIRLVDAVCRTALGVGDRALDVGCGTGRVARTLADHGLRAVGVDVADGMVEIARREHPDVEFAVGELARLPFSSARFAAVISWYSIIATPPRELGDALAEFARVVTPDGVVLVAFQSGDGIAVERPDAYGSGTDLTLYRHDPATVADLLERQGLALVSAAERPPDGTHETTRQAFITARRR